MKVDRDSSSAILDPLSISLLFCDTISVQEQEMNLFLTY